MQPIQHRFQFLVRQLGRPYTRRTAADAHRVWNQLNFRQDVVWGPGTGWRRRRTAVRDGGRRLAAFDNGRRGAKDQLTGLRLRLG